MFLVRKTAVAAAVVVQCALLAACGGGGGATIPVQPGDGWNPPTQPGSGGGGSTSEQPPAPPPSYGMSPMLLKTGYYEAHRNGYKGATDQGERVTVAVIDTGFDRGSAATTEFGDRLLGGYDASKDGEQEVQIDSAVNRDAYGSNGHGTAVARVVASSGRRTTGSQVTDVQIGFAPEANIYPIKGTPDDSAFLSSTYVGKAIEHVASKSEIRIVNNSYGGSPINVEQDLNAIKSIYRPAINAKKLLVFASGNNGGIYDAPILEAHLATDTEFAPYVLVVGAVNGGDLTMTGYSQKAGPTKDRYLVAPVSVNLGTSPQSPDWMGGTSLAAPQVSGAAAVVMGRWPYLSADRVATILLETAQDLGEPGVDEVYGHGLLRLDRAMQPQGDLIAPMSTGGSVALGQPLGVVSPQVGKQLAPLSVQFFDRYGRNYAVSAQGLLPSGKQESGREVVRRVADDAQPVAQVASGGATFAWAGVGGDRQPFMSVSLAGERFSGRWWTGAKFAPHSLQDNPMVGAFGQRSAGGGMRWSLTPDLRLSADVASGQTLTSSSTTALQYGFEWSQGAWSFKAALGSARVAAIGDGSDRRSLATLGVSYAISPSATLGLEWQQGSKDQRFAFGLGAVEEKRNVVTLRYEHAGVAAHDDRLTLALRLPQSVRYTGALELPTGVNMQTGSPVFERVNLSGSAQEPARLALGYASKVDRRSSIVLGASMGARPSDRAVEVSYRLSF